ncbi:hypothetical protein VNO80_13446 [Phaseolus coccineus]|uniref:Uncharacterized protein n=1 Tax=Phaseolus coccineus TaxID=3886 RepID=A0AAN9N0Z2_PHACN
MAQANSYKKLKPVRSTDRGQRWTSMQLPEIWYIPLQRSGGNRNYSNGLFGVAKFPVQMELSDIRKRQSARSAVLETAARDGEQEKGEKMGLEWQLIRTLRRKSRQWLNMLST